MAKADIELKNAVIEALDAVQDPMTQKPILDALMVDEVTVNQGQVTIRMMFQDAHTKDQRWDVEDQVCDAVESIDAVEDVNVLSTTESGSEPAPSSGGHSHGSHGHSHSHSSGTGASGSPSGTPTSRSIAGVGKVIAVASGKGGVGKSTVAVNLALALKTIGYRAGLLDIDVYGPSLPTLLGVKGRPAVKDRRIIPLEAEGLKIMSLGFLMDDDTPVIWRGPIVSGIIRQFLQDVDWSGLDYLIIDLPPGTGDAQLSLAQSVPLDGAIVVTTPSDLALVDAARGLQMFKTLKVDVLGIVENMSHYIWPGIEGVRQTLDLLRSKGGPQEAIDQLEQTLKEHGRVYVFGQGGGRREARRLGTDFLGEIPLNGKVREGGDQGQPIVTNDPTGPVTAAFVQLAKTLAELQPVASAEGEDKPKKKKRGLFSFLKG
ncbi:MAG: Mrp/NBP35 family ATP-binding protein [Myxococcota bacterium]